MMALTWQTYPGGMLIAQVDRAAYFIIRRGPWFVVLHTVTGLRGGLRRRLKFGRFRTEDEARRVCEQHHEQQAATENQSCTALL